ncbi:MAG TPA: magnesium transporter [Oculatellaceae cyanobacterium]|jgi:magnesium transporter
MATVIHTSLAEKIKRYLAQKNTSALRRLLARQNFVDIADVMENALTPQEAQACFQYLNVGQAAQVLASVNEDLQRLFLASLPTVMGSQILRMMPTDDAVDILQEMDTEDSKRILAQMPFDVETRTLHHLMMEEPDSAAGIMSTDYVSVSIESTVGETLAVVKQAEEKDFIYYVYLVDSENRLVGVTSLKRLLIHDENEPVSKIAEFDVKSLLTNYDQELVSNIFRKYYNLLAMPVTDPDNVLCGIVTIDDIIDVIEEETSEDIYKASGISMEEVDERGLLIGPVFGAFKARFPWLSITMGGQFLAATIIAHFQETVSTAVIAISFMPLLTGLSGNMGTQSETITVRGLALNIIHDRNIVAMLLRELRVALLTGAFFALCVGALSFVIYHKWQLSLLLGSWIIISQCTFAFLGMLIPYWVKRLFKIDPAGIGGPFITTMSDILTFLVYLSVVSFFIKYMI